MRSWRNAMNGEPAKKERNLLLEWVLFRISYARARWLRIMSVSFLIASTFQGSSAFAAEAPPDRPTPCLEKAWMNKHRYLTSLALQASHRPRLDIYFLGDSITEFWPYDAKEVWHAEFGSMQVLNCGVAGDKTQNILYRVSQGEFEHLSPKVIVLLAGINNLSESPALKPAELAQGHRRILETLRAKSPQSRILLLSIFPSGEPSDPIRERIRATNQLLAGLADGKSIFYLDIYDRFLDAHGVLPGDVSPDGTHLYAKGYRIWADAMRPKLMELLAVDGEGKKL